MLTRLSVACEAVAELELQSCVVKQKLCSKKHIFLLFLKLILHCYDLYVKNLCSQLTTQLKRGSAIDVREVVLVL
jgi:hypothetical protein